MTITYVQRLTHISASHAKHKYTQIEPLYLKLHKELSKGDLYTYSRWQISTKFLLSHCFVL